MDSYQFSPDVRRHLADMLTGMHSRAEHPYALYSHWRAALTLICPVDAFFVGLFHEDDFIVFPYAFDGGECEIPEARPYDPEGVAAWVRSHKRPYTYADDGGRRLNRGVSFGDVTRLSADAMTVPLIESAGKASTVIGIASAQTYQAGSYTAEHVRIFSWTARVVALLLTNRRQEMHELQALEQEAGIHVTAGDTIVGMVHELNRKLDKLRKKIAAIAIDDSLSDDERRSLAQQAMAHCEQMQTEIIELLVQPAPERTRLLAQLTPREREVADLIAEGLNNKEIALRLTISEGTVKTHVGHVLEKLQVKQRAGVAPVLRRFG
jgi:DNA-binding NarL/FixJ family response regulator